MERTNVSSVEGPMEFSEVIGRRRSVRHFDNKQDVTDAQVRELLFAATAAPSAGNIQPWRFTVVRSPEARERLAGALRQRWATAAPVIIVVSADPRPCLARYGDRGEALYAIQDTAAAVEHILLAAVDMGLASCWIGAFDDDAVRQAAGLDRAMRPVAVLPIGYSAESSSRPERRPLDEITTWI